MNQRYVNKKLYFCTKINPVVGYMAYMIPEQGKYHEVRFFSEAIW